jgi:Fe-Mn family superoxide dismutase
MNTPSLFSRRTFLSLSAAVAAASFFPGCGTTEKPAAGPVVPPPPTGPYKLGPLPYAFEALEPHFDTATMRIHHGKHHQAYVDNLNKAVATAPNNPFHDDARVLVSDLSKISDSVRTAVRNHGGGHANHTFFWSSLAPAAGGDPAGKLGDALTAQFGSLAKFREDFAKAGMSRFGSGWAWLVKKADGSLAITSTPNQDSPWMKGIPEVAVTGQPLLALDVWEHAYYLKYQNRRADYIAAYWNVVNWAQAERLYTEG